jgi:hypothetical protein
VLERIKETGDIFYAQADRKWIQDGVAVRVSMIGFDDGSETRRFLNENPDDNPDGALDRALPVEGINTNLTSALDLTQARRLKENVEISFQGPSPKAAFDIDAGLAQRMLNQPINPNHRPNSDVVRPLMTAKDLAQGSRSRWTLDFDLMSEEQAAFYEVPFEYVKKNVLPLRLERRDDFRGNWWQFARPRPEMRNALRGKTRFIATPRHSKHRVFVWAPAAVLCNDSTIVFARDDDYFIGILHSRPHELWARATGTQLREVTSGFRYTPTTCFETFPFPQPTEIQKGGIAEVAAELNRLREGWLNPDTSTGMLSEKELKARTLTNLYNQRPTWLVNAHRTLDAAVFAAYGWPEPPDQLSDAEILARLLKLNLEREPA